MKTFKLNTTVTVTYDEEANVFCATCDDFQPYLGIVTEGATLEELRKKLGECFSSAVEEVSKSLPYTH